MRRDSKAALTAVALLLASACTTTGGMVRPGVEPDLEEAAKLNTQLGIEYLRKGEDAAAMEKLKKALDQDDGQGMAHAVIAFLYQRQGEFDLADKHYRKALSRNDEDPSTLNNYGVFLCGRGEFRKAEKMFLEATEIRANTAIEDSWANAGSCLRTREPKRAEDYLRNALKIDPRHPNALAQLAELTYDKQDYLRARAFLQRYQSVARDTSQTLYVAVRTERALGDLQAARVYERRLRSEFPGSREVELLERQ